MIAIDVAQKLIRDATEANNTWRVLLLEALGKTAGADVASDVDSPPYDKSLVDGYAVLAADVQDAPVELQVVEEVMAGQVPQRSVTTGTAIRIMTGAPIPSGADAVVMVEDTRRVDDSHVKVTVDRLESGQSIMRQGVSMKREQVVLRRGTPIRAVEIGLLAELGCDGVEVYRTPTVALIETGDELVPSGQPLKPGQIRDSNGPMLWSLVNRAGGCASPLGIARDDRQALRDMVTRGLEEDILILSGGVSAGAKDFVPDVLAELGVKQVFHKVQIRPGKPIWFGVKSDGPDQKLVFGLPGNPVSSLVCFYVFVAPAIRRKAGREAAIPQWPTAQLGRPHVVQGARPTFWPAIRRSVPGQMIEQVEPLDWLGSADLCTVASADCLVFFAEGDRPYRVGELLPVVPLE
jgi:molybdopterin molybdotransferase